MSPSSILRLPTTTWMGEADDATQALVRALRFGDLCGASGAIADGAWTDLEFTWFQRDSGDAFGGLTALSLAALVDSEAGVAVALPLLLNRGGDIGQVDSKGRTLLHFALADPVARYLVENGVPLPHGAREKVVEGLSHPSGDRFWFDDIQLSFRDDQGCEAPITRRMRPSAASRPVELPAVPMSPGQVVDLARPDLVEAMEELGYFATSAWRDANDPFHWPGAPPLTAFIPAGQEIRHAILSGDEGRVARLVALGGGGGRGRFSHTSLLPGHVTHYRLLTPAGLSVLRDSESGKVELCSLFASPGADMSAPGHAEGGQTLLHLAVSPVVCKWLLERGASPDIANEDGNLPEDVLPGPAAAVISQWRLQGTLSPASVPGGKGLRL